MVPVMAKTPMSNTAKPINFQFITVVWGKPYVDLLVNVAIPSQMASGNLPSFQYLETSTYIIYTTSEDREALDNSPAFGHLSQLMPTEIRLIDDIDLHKNKYGIASECQKRALSSAKNSDVAFVWLYPDVVWPDGALTNMGRIAASGKRAVMHMGLSAVTETCVSEILREHHHKDSDTISIPPRDLVKLAIKHFDPILNTLFWNSDKFNTSPSQLYWEVPNEGLIAHWFHLVPLMVYPRNNICGFTSSIDSGDFVKQAGLSTDDIYVAEDSDEIFQFSFNTPWQTHKDNTSSIVNVLRWAASTNGTIDVASLRHQFRVHYAEMTPDKWSEVARESDAVIAGIARVLRFRFLFLLINRKQLTERISWRLRHSMLGRVARSVLKREASSTGTNP